MNPEDVINSPILSLSMTQKFEMEKLNRMIDSCNDVEELRKVGKMLIQAWMVQKSATNWMIKQSLGIQDK